MRSLLVPLMILSSLGSVLAAAPPLEVLPWGNLRGLRIDDSLVPLESAFRIEAAAGVEQTAHYSQTAYFRRVDGHYEVFSQMKHGDLRQVFTADGPGNARIDVTFMAREPMDLRSASLVFTLPVPAGADWTVGNAGGSVRPGGLGESAALGELSASAPARIEIGDRRYAFEPSDARQAVLTRVDAGTLRLAISAASARKLGAGDELRLSVALTASAAPDHAPARLVLHPDKPGATWDGIGGDFRLQFPETDPTVIDYNLAHLPVRWARIAMWWSDWDPAEGRSPRRDYMERDPSAKIVAQVAMAKRLVDAGNSLIVSAWTPPSWAVLEGVHRPGTYGHLLDPAKTDREVDSIVAYLLMLRDRYGVKVDLFSFNEPDIGMRVVQDPELHVTFMRALALAMVKAGLSTRILAADTSNATPYARSLAEAACTDPVLRAHMGAIGFHTWGGCEPENLRAWSALARANDLPLLVTEGGADSEAHRSPDLFLDERYQFDQCALYLDISRWAQPATIMEWQLTADYSVLDGGGAYGREGPLAPTLRFWLLWHLGQAPAGYRHIPVDIVHGDVSAAALVGNRGRVVVHVLNSGAGRTLHIDGLPAGCTQLVPLVSGIRSGGNRRDPIPVADGKAQFDAPARSLVTFLGNGVRAE